MRGLRAIIVEYWQNTDKLLWFCCLAVSAVGCVLLRGILDTGYQQSLGISDRNLLVQVAAIGLGVLAALILSGINYNLLKKTWVLHTPLVYLLVVLTFFIGVGAAERPDDKRWLVLPVIDVWLQPAELLKISFILVFAYHIVRASEHGLNHHRTVLLLALHAAAPVVLIHFQGDDGTALLIGVIAVAMLFMAGIHWKYVAGAIASLVVLVPLAWMFVLNEFQKQRILTLLNQEEADTLGWYFQQYRAKVAIAMGGETGVGLMDVSHIYVPEMHTDFIFAFLCESFGFMGALGIVVLMVAMSFRLLRNATRAADQYGSLICVGVFAMILFQFVVNVGMCLSLIPVIGNPFPFLSYGGSSTVTCYLGIGLAQSVYTYRSKGMFSHPAM